MSGQGPSRLADAEVRAAVSDLLAAAGPCWLPEQRWFADKGRSIERVQLDDLLVQPGDPELLLLAIVIVEFAEGPPARYLLPLAIVPHAAPGDVIVPAPFLSGSHVLIDGLAMPQFGHWLLDLWERQTASESDAWQFTSSPAARDLLAHARASEAVPMRAEQSNTSIRFDEALIVKLFRRLQPGPNPDEEVLRALDEVSFPRVPQFAGSASWRAAAGVDYPIALVQAFVVNQGDGWSWMIQRLRTLATSPSPDDFAAERLLGRRTAELHLALGNVDSPEFSPQQADLNAIAADRERRQAATERVIALLYEREASLPGEVRTRLPSLVAALRRAAMAASNGYQAEASLPRIRGHGDFHLGQTLRTPDDDWILIDFEGEPARPVEERRQRAPVLKDIAGMLRSFNYARGVVEREAAFAKAPDAIERLHVWERGARDAFLTGYREAIRPAGRVLVPADEDAFARALAAWELEKALYEIEYEARNRPDWLEIPLSAVLSGLEGTPKQRNQSY